MYGRGYLDCGDDYMGVYVCQNWLSCTLTKEKCLCISNISQILGSQDTSQGFWREGPSRFWRLPYEPLLLCSMNSFLSHFSPSSPVPVYLVFHRKILFIPQCTNTEPCCTEHLIEGLVMREGSHITGEEAIKAGYPARWWHSSSALEDGDSASTPGCSLPGALLLSLLDSRAKTRTRDNNRKPSSPIMLWNRKMSILSLFLTSPIVMSPGTYICRVQNANWSNFSSKRAFIS